MHLMTALGIVRSLQCDARQFMGHLNPRGLRRYEESTAHPPGVDATRVDRLVAG
jgi:hypothetical protein